MPTLFLNTDTGLVSNLSYGQNAASFQAPRGLSLLQVVLVRTVGSDATVTPYLLPVDQTLGLVLRDPANIQEGYAAGPVYGTRGGTPAPGYLFSVDTDTTLIRDLMDVDSKEKAEALIYLLSASVFIQFPVGKPQESLAFPWAVLASYFRPGTPPADILQTYPSAQQLQDAVASVVNKQERLPTPTANGQFLTANPDRTYSWVTFPTGVAGVWDVGGNLVVTGTTTLNGTSTVNAALTVNGTLHVVDPATFDDVVEAGGFSGSGASLVNLDADQLTTGTVPLSALPTSVRQSLRYAGAWNAQTNSPGLSDSPSALLSVPGAMYRVSVAGNTYLGGTLNWLVGDYAWYDGNAWNKIHGAANEVTSVDGVEPLYDSNGNVVLPSDQEPSVGSKRTLGTGGQQAAPGNSTGLGATFTSPGGLVFRPTTASTDRKAVAGTDFLSPNGSGAALTHIAPYHDQVDPVTGNLYQTSGQVVTQLGAGTNFSGTDVYGTIKLGVGTAAPPADKILYKVIFGKPYLGNGDMRTLIWYRRAGEDTTLAKFDWEWIVTSGSSGPLTTGFNVLQTQAASAGGVLTYMYYIPTPAGGYGPNP